MWEHSMGCSYPEGCNCGASARNALEKRAKEAERPKVNLELSELYTIAVAHGYSTPRTMIDELLKEKKLVTDNVKYILKDDPDVIHACEGGGPEDLMMSLALTVLRTRNSRDIAVNNLIHNVTRS